MPTLAQLYAERQSAKQTAEPSPETSKLAPWEKAAARVEAYEREQRANPSTGVTGDVGRMVGVGLNQLADSGGYLLEKMGMERAGRWVQDKAQQRIQDLYSELTPEQQAANQLQFTHKENGEFGIGPAFTSPRALVGQVASSAPAMGFGMGLGGVVTRSLAAAGAGRAAAAGIGYGAGEGAVAGGLAGKDMVNEIRNAPIDSLRETEPYRMALESLTDDEGLSPENREALAREKMATAAYLETAGKVGLATAILSAPSGVMFDKLLRGAGLTRSAAPSLAKDLPLYMAGEGLQEFPQEGAESIISGQAAEKYAGAEPTPWSEHFERAVAGGVTGAVTGGVMGGPAHVAGAMARRSAPPALPENVAPQAPSGRDERTEEVVQEAAQAGPEESWRPTPLALPAPAVTVTPDGTAVLPRQLNDMVNARLNAGGMSPEQVAAGRRKLAGRDEPSAPVVPAKPAGALEKAATLAVPEVPEVVAPAPVSGSPAAVANHWDRLEQLAAQEAQPVDAGGATDGVSEVREEVGGTAQAVPAMRGEDVVPRKVRVLAAEPPVEALAAPAVDAGSGLTTEVPNVTTEAPVVTPSAGEQTEPKAARVTYPQVARQAKGLGLELSRKQPDGSFVATRGGEAVFTAASLSEIPARLAEVEKTPAAVGGDRVADAGKTIAEQASSEISEKNQVDGKVQGPSFAVPAGGATLAVGDVFDLDGVEYRLESLKNGAVEAVDESSGAVETWPSLEAFERQTGRRVADRGAAVDAVAHEAATSPENNLPEPTQAQKEAGNYKKGHVKLHGLDISIENPKGSDRSGVDPDGKPWSVKMPAHYGYVKRTEGADGDHVDVYIGPNPESARVFIVDQLDHETGKFDEHKIILGADGLEQAASIYRAGFSDGLGGKRLGALTEMSVDGFRQWLKDGDTSKPLEGTIRAESESEPIVKGSLATERDELIDRHARANYERMKRDAESVSRKNGNAPREVSAEGEARVLDGQRAWMGKIYDAVEAKDFGSLSGKLHQGNPQSIRLFGEIVGKKIKTDKDVRAALRELDPQKFDAWERSREAARANEKDARERREKEKAVEGRRYRHEGRELTAKELIDELVDTGHTDYSERKKGIVPIGFLRKPGEGSGYQFKSKDERAYIQQRLGDLASRPNDRGTRKATAEGAARVEAAQKRLREVMANKDIVGKQRADMVAAGRNLIQFLLTYADKDLETGFFKGDPIAYTQEDAPEGFRSFIYLDGVRAGEYGVERMPEAKAEDAARTQREWKEQQEGFARVREAEKLPSWPEFDDVLGRMEGQSRKAGVLTDANEGDWRALAEGVAKIEKSDVVSSAHAAEAISYLNVPVGKVSAEVAERKKAVFEAAGLPVPKDVVDRSDDLKSLAKDIRNSQVKLERLNKGQADKMIQGEFTRAKTTTYNAAASNEAARLDDNRKALAREIRAAWQRGETVDKDVVAAAGSSVDYDESGNYAPVERGAEKAAAEQGPYPVISPDDLPTAEIVSAYSHTSHRTRAAAEIEQRQYVEFMQELKDDMLKDLPAGNEGLLAAELGRVKGEYLARRKRVLTVRGNTVSAHVAGRSKFNSKQAEQRGSALDKAEDSFADWLRRVPGEVAEAVGVAAVRTEQDRQKAERKQAAREEADRREKEQRKAEIALPIVNRRGAGVKEITREEWSKASKDYKSIIVSADGTFRYRSMLTQGGLSPVFITDMKVVEAPGTEQVAAKEQDAGGYGVKDHTAFFKRLADGEVTAAEIQTNFQAVIDNKEAIVAELSGMKKDDLLNMLGGMSRRNYKNDKKDAIVRAVYEDMQHDFVLGNGYTYGMGAGSRLAAIKKIVDGLTDDDVAAHAKSVEASRQETKEWVENRAKAMKDPQTLDAFAVYLRGKVADGMTERQARLSLSPEQRARFDALRAAESRKNRTERKTEQKATLQVAGQTVAGSIIETKHTKKGHDLFVVQLAERVERDDYNALNASAKRLGGYYSSFRGGGAVPGFQFTSRENAEAFVQLAGGDASAAKAAVNERLNAFEDDRSQSAAERLTAMADAMEERADESLGRERKANTQRRAGMAARAEAAANADKALAQTMRNLAAAIESGDAEFLDRVREKKQVEFLTSALRLAKWNEVKEKYESTQERNRHENDPPTAETADYADYPTFSAFRSDLAALGRKLEDVDGLKQLGQRLLRVADDVTDAYVEFAKANLQKVSTFARKDGEAAMFASRQDAEAAIARSGYKGQAIVLPVKRGQNLIVLSPAEARRRGVWEGDDDKRITLSADFGAELMEKLGRAAKRNRDLSVPWQFESVMDRRKLLSRMGIETAAEFRSALREFAGLQEQTKEPDRVKELERQMLGRKNDGLDFFPTPQSVADEMVAAADIQEGMAVLEPSAGWGHIAERIREAGHEPEVVELSNERKELLEAKGFNVVGRDFLEISPRDFTWGDIFRAKDGTEGRLGMTPGWELGSERVALKDEDGDALGYYDRSELEPVRKDGANSGYDRIIMNPPFSDRRDIQHVYHAYDLLKPGGRLVAIMSEGVFFGQDKKASAFRDWVESVGGTDEKLEQGVFNDPSLPVNTGVAARMVVIDKQAGVEAPKFSVAERTKNAGAGRENGYNDEAPKFSINPTGDPETYERMRGGIYVVPEQVQPKTIERFGGGGLREAEAHARASLRAVRLDDERGQGSESWFAREKHAREVILPAEREALRSWAKEEDLIIPAATFERMWQREGKRGGREHDVFLDPGTGRWYKRQKLSLNSSYTDYFQRLILTNKLNDNRADYRLEGFVEQDGDLFPVVSQADVTSSRWLTNTDVHNLLTARGFERIDDGPPGMMGWWKVPGEDYVFTDLNGQNVTIDDAGKLVFIDPFIEPDFKTQGERMAAELYLEELESKGYRFAAGETATKKNSLVPGPLSDVEFDAIFKRITSGIKDPAARDGFVVTATASELPPRILAEIEKQGNAPSDIDGVFHRGKVYLVRENITSAERLEEVLFHEWHGHAGLFAMFGSDGAKLKSAMVDLYNAVTPLRLYPLGRKYGINLVKYGQALAKAGYDLDTRRAIMAEEMLSFLTKEYSKGTIARKVREVVGQVREWLRKAGFAKLAEWGETDIAFLLKRARVYAEAGVWAKDGPVVAVSGEEILKRLRDAGVTDGMLAKLMEGTRFAAAYHGSPHDFDRFSTENIGTGEGAQAYGYGLYFAGAREVAEYYRRELSDPKMVVSFPMRNAEFVWNESGWVGENGNTLAGAERVAANAVAFDENDVEVVAKFSVASTAQDRAKAQAAFAKTLTADRAGAVFKTLGSMLPERMKAAVGSVLSNPHYESRKSKWRGAAYELALERGANANEIKHEVMAASGDYAGLEGVRDFYRKAAKAERAMLDKLLVEGDIRGEEYSLEDLLSGKNPVGPRLPDRVVSAYLDFRQTLAKSNQVMFDRLGRLRLLPYEGSEFYQELVGLLDTGMSKDELRRRFGINEKAVEAYLRIRADRKKLDEAVKPYRQQAWHDNLREVLEKGLTSLEVQNEFGGRGGSKEFMEAFREAKQKIGADGIATAERFKRAQWYSTLADLLTQGDSHPMLQKLELYNAYLGVKEYDSQLAKLKDQWGQVKGYLPRIRKDGEQHVKVYRVEEDGSFTEVWMQPAKSVFGAKRLQAQVMKDLQGYIPHSFDPDAQYEVVVEPNTATPEEIFMGIGSHRAIEALLSKVFDKATDAGLLENRLEVQNQVLRILADEISSRGFGRHKLHRAEHLIEGYETENTPAILAQFIGGMAGWLSKSEFAMRANKLMAEIPATRPEDKTWVREYVDDALKNSTWLDQWFGTARSFAALMYLGFKASSAILNATQNYVWGQAVLSKHTGGATTKLMKAQADVLQDHLLTRAGKAGVLTAEERWVLEEGLRRGRSHANYVRAMSGLDDNGGVLGKGQAGIRWLTEKAMIPFQAVETYWNREPALLAGYRVFRAQGMEKEAALAKAEKFVDDVHFVVSKENIPGLLRKMGPVGRTLYTFQSYSHNYLLGMFHAMKDGEAAVVMRSLTALVLFGGLAAVPFGDDLDKWYRRVFGERPLRMLEGWLKETAGEYTDFGDQIADFVIHGAPALAGVNFSRALGVNVSFLSAEDDTLAERLGGVWGGLANKVKFAGMAAAKGDAFRAAEFMAPEALANLMRSYRHYADGATTLSGRPVFGDDGKQVKYTAAEGVIRAFGFMPLRPSKQTEKRWDARLAREFWNDRKSDILAQWRRAPGDKKVLEQVRKFNRELRDAPARPLVSAISPATLRRALKDKPDRGELAY